ncbi:M42 family metallopeptidase [Candidatus Methylacidithermus pantelleriae]|uniref:Endoglucanase n=1 Tax=Candidatus Methylacidithermus pantelleriae TaxID=2744239 RepID=A0A8J2BMI6_9BACT|nr:M42 family metallopeptidase [Candidatus Methylacidithermus pantelleriae]CAF0689727.1 Endoglucanase [Candidatus Methylacidithermus pantelleriae]
MRPESLQFLKDLIDTPSPAGGEYLGQKLWLDYVRPWADEVRTDAYGNALAILNPAGRPKILVCGHVDEIGFQVQYVDEEGFIYFQPVGGSDPALARGQRVYIHHDGEEVLGVIGSLAIHMQERDKKPEIPQWHELFIDIGARNRQEALQRIRIGDLITYVDRFEPLTGDIWVGRACDNRVGSFVAAEVLRLCMERRDSLWACVVAASTIQEENGLYGAKMIAYSVGPDAAIVIDVGHATDIPIANKKKFGEIRLGAGPILSRGSANHPGLVERLQRIAEEHQIPFQWNVDPRRTGTDADAIFTERGGIPTVSIGIPNRYMHSPVEAVHLGDIERAAEWIQAFLMALDPKTEFRVTL